MASISENLQTIKNSVSAIKQAISDKGGDVSGDISTWANVIGGLSGGGSSSSSAGSVFKITNKLNGQLFGGYQYSNNSFLGEIVHEYLFEGGILESMVLVPVNITAMLGDVFPSSNGMACMIGNAGSEKNTGLPYVYISTNIVSSSEIRCGILFVNLCKDGTLVFCGQGAGSLSVEPGPLEVALIVFDTNKNYDIDFFRVQSGGSCFAKGTKISLSDSITKNVEDITYNDNLHVWNFDEGKYDSAKPLWIKKTQVSTYYYKVTLDNGTILKLVGSNGKCHRLFSFEDGMFISATDMVGKTTYTESGKSKVLSCELIQEEVEFYNIITKHHINLFANGVLTSCRYNNIYPIQDMKFIKDERLNRAPKWKLYEQFRDYKCLSRYIEGLRLYEQLDIPLEDIIKYCERLESLRKNLDEFEGNENILNTIEDTEVGWIDREGKSYGFKLYMPGHNNHIILADKICKELNIETDNPSRYLEKEGWVKYSTDYVLSSDDKEITDKQLKSLREFLKVPNKLKEDSKIRIGSAMSPHVDISEFDTMDKYSFEYRKKHNIRR